jgi:hypothetical protein
MKHLVLAAALVLAPGLAHANGGLAQALGNMGAIANGYANPGVAQQLLLLQQLQQYQQPYQPMLQYRTYSFPSGTLHCYGTPQMTSCY